MRDIEQRNTAAMAKYFVFFVQVVGSLQHDEPPYSHTQLVSWRTAQDYTPVYEESGNIVLFQHQMH